MVNLPSKTPVEVLVPVVEEVIELEKPKRGRPKKNKDIASEEVLVPAFEEVNEPEKPKRGRPKKNKDIALKNRVRGVCAEVRSMMEELGLGDLAVKESTGERALEPTLEEVVEPALKEVVEPALGEVELAVTEVATVGKTVERRKVVSPALKSGVRKRFKKVAKSRSPKSKAGGKRMRESVPPSTNTSPVLKPPQKSRRVTRRGAGIVERLIA